MNDLSKACLDEAKNSMKSALAFLDKELAKIRAGKANPGMLDGVKVDYYGTMTEISQVANINTPDARSIVIQPWEKTLVGAINKAILDANLGFTPRHEGDILRITVPPLTEERRKELCKAAKVEVENAKVLKALVEDSPLAFRFLKYSSSSFSAEFSAFNCSIFFTASSRLVIFFI